MAALAYEPIFTCYLQYPDPCACRSPMIGFDGGRIASGYSTVAGYRAGAACSPR